MKKKAYVHYESSKHANLEPITISVWVEEDTLAIDVLKKISHSILVEQSKEIPANHMNLTHSNGDVFDDESLVHDRIDNKDDLFVVDSARPKNVPPSSKTPPNAVNIPSPVEAKVTSQSSRSDLVAMLQEKVSKKNFKRARELCEEILKASPDDTIALEYLAHISYATGRYDKAIVCGEKVLQSNSPAVRSGQQLGIYLVMAQAHREEGDYEDAIESIMSCLQILEKGTSRMSMSTEDLHTLELDLNAELTRCLFSLGRHGDAGNRINAVMTDPSYAARGLDTQGHAGCLLAYAEIAFQYDKVGMASCHTVSYNHDMNCLSVHRADPGGSTGSSQSNRRQPSGQASPEAHGQYLVSTRGSGGAVSAGPPQ